MYHIHILSYEKFKLVYIGSILMMFQTWLINLSLTFDLIFFFF